MHRWTQFKREDPDLAEPGRDAVWVARCRDCAAERGSGFAFMVGVSSVCLAAGVLLWWLVSPVLGILLFLGAVTGAGWAARAVWLSSYTRRAGFRYRG